MKRFLYLILLLCLANSGFITLNSSQDDQKTDLGLEVSLPIAFALTVIFVIKVIFKIAKRVRAKNNLRLEYFNLDSQPISSLLQDALVDFGKDDKSFVTKYYEFLNKIDENQQITVDSKNFLRGVAREIFNKFQSLDSNFKDLPKFLEDKDFLTSIIIESGKTLGLEILPSKVDEFLKIKVENESAKPSVVESTVVKPKVVFDAEKEKSAFDITKENYQKLVSSLITDNVKGEVYAGVKDGIFYLKSGDKYYRVSKIEGELKLFKLKQSPGAEFGIKALDIGQNQRTGLYTIDLFSPDGRRSLTTTVSDGRLIRQSEYHNDPTRTGFYRIDPDGVMHIISEEEEGSRFGV